MLLVLHLVSDNWDVLSLSARSRYLTVVPSLQNPLLLLLSFSFLPAAHFPGSVRITSLEVLFVGFRVLPLLLPGQLNPSSRRSPGVGLCCCTMADSRYSSLPRLDLLPAPAAGQMRPAPAAIPFVPS